MTYISCVVFSPLLYHVPVIRYRVRYHAHHHGSTGIQAGGGLAGVLIVEDLECDIPTWVSALPEQTLMIHEVAPADLNGFGINTNNGNCAIDHLWTTDFTTDTDFLLVNGITMPDVTIAQNTPTRLRMVYAAILATLQLTVDTTADLGCTWKVLAKDGVYLFDAPRDATTLYLAPGNRVDVVVTCTTVGTTKVVSGTGQTNTGPGGRGGRGGQAAAMLNQDVFNLIVSTSAAAAPAELVTFQARRPSYMADLQSATVADTGFTLALAGGQGVAGCTVNGQSYTHTSARTLQIGDVVQWGVTGTGGHPFHLVSVRRPRPRSPPLHHCIYLSF